MLLLKTLTYATLHCVVMYHSTELSFITFGMSKEKHCVLNLLLSTTKHIKQADDTTFLIIIKVVSLFLSILELHKMCGLCYGQNSGVLS